MDKVSLLKCESYSAEVLDGIIEQHFAALEADGPLIKQGANVVLKPNLVLAKRNSEDVSAVNPEFVAAIIRAVKKRGGNVRIAESPGGTYTPKSLKNVYKSTGIEKVAEENGVELNFDVGTTVVKSSNWKVCSAFDIINPIATADIVISVAKLKTHAQMVYTGAVKNLFGTLAGLQKPEFHYRYPEKETFANMIVDLCETVNPAISFIDGIVGMEGNGPTGGNPKRLNVTLAGLNPYALDLAALWLIGFKPDEVPIIHNAIKRGLCPADSSGLEFLGDARESLRSDFKRPDSVSMDFLKGALPDFLVKIIGKPLAKLFTPRPVINLPVCVGCGKCAESCPQKTIKIVDHKAVIHDDQCIKCFCCHEMCPKKAIAIKRFKLFG